MKIPQWPRTDRGSARAASRFAGWLVVAGLALAVAWAVFAPRALWVVQGNGGGLKDGNTQAFVGADAIFLICGVVLGVAAGVVAFHLARRSGPLIALALFFGSLAGSFVAAVVGHWITLGQFASAALSSPGGTTVRYFLTVRAGVAIVVWPLAAMVSLAFFTAWRWPTDQPAQDAGWAPQAHADETSYAAAPHPVPWQEQPGA